MSERRSVNVKAESEKPWHDVSYVARKFQIAVKLDGVRPVDNRPFPDKLHQFVKKIKKIITNDT